MSFGDTRDVGLMRTRTTREGANGFFRGTLPRSLHVEQVLRQRLQREYPPGSRFPSEPDLTREFGVSRTLVRGVLARLTREGLIRREAKRGTFVSARRGRARGPELSDLMERLLDWGPDTVVKVLGTNTTLGALDVKARLRLPAAAPLVVIRRLVLQRGTPVSYTVSFLPYELGSRLTTAELERHPIAALLPSRHATPIRDAVQTIEPVVADVEVAGQLGVPVGSPLLLVERDFLGRRGVPVYHSRAFYRSDRYKFDVALRRHRESTGARRRARG